MTRTLTSIAIIVLASGAAHAQFMRPFPPAPPAEAKPKAEPQPPPSLDDLLGLTPDKPANKDKPAPPPVDPTKVELERMLSAKEAADQFKQAVALMAQTADRLQSSRDTSLETQRIQEDIIRKLDQVIHSAQQQQQSKRQKRQQSPQDPSQQNQPNQQQPSERQEASKDPAQDTINPPGRSEGQLNPDAAARGAMWGELPIRMREALLQGNADKYSSLYPKQTEAYYKKLAEEGSR